MWWVETFLVTLLYLCSHFQTVRSTGKFELYLERYSNAKAQGSNGHCCDGKWIFCDGYCEHYFKVCVGNVHSAHISDCPYGHYQTSHYDSQNHITFSHVLNGGQPNPKTFQVTPDFLNKIRLRILVQDYDPVGGHDHVDDLVATIDVRAYPNKQTAVSMPFRMEKNTILYIRYKAYCDPNYYPPYCNVYCKARDDNGGHYTCDPNTGAKICIKGWEGVDCNKDTNECQSAIPVCKNGATCHNTDGSYECQCAPAFEGTHCETPFSSCKSDPCENGANCTDSGLTHNCTCTEGWTGVFCETKITPCDSMPCENNGSCSTDADNVDYNCTCDIEWKGKNCSLTAIVDFTGTPSQLELLGIIDDTNRQELHDGLKDLLKNLLNITKKIYIKVNVAVRYENNNTISQVQFIGATNLGKDVINNREVDDIINNTKSETLEQYLPLPIYIPPPSKSGQQNEDPPPVPVTPRPRPWMQDNWYIIVIIVLIILIAVAIIVIIIVFKKCRNKTPFESTLANGHGPPGREMAFENVLYDRNRENTAVVENCSAENVRNEIRQATPEEYMSPVPIEGKLLQAAPPEGAVGGDPAYQEIDCEKTKQKEKSLSFHNTRTDYLQPCADMPGVGNNYTDFRNITGGGVNDFSTDHALEAAAAAALEEAGYHEIGEEHFRIKEKELGLEPSLSFHNTGTDYMRPQLDEPAGEEHFKTKEKNLELEPSLSFHNTGTDYMRPQVDEPAGKNNYTDFRAIDGGAHANAAFHANEENLYTDVGNPPEDDVQELLPEDEEETMDAEEEKRAPEDSEMPHDDLTAEHPKYSEA